MPKATPLINNFNGGELSPKIDARSDIQKYLSGCRTLENMIPLVEGGATRMPGSYFVIETKDSSKASRLIPFQFSTIQSYQLEFGDEYIRFYKETAGIKGQIVLAYAVWLTAQVYTIGLLRTNGGNYYRCLVAHTSGVFATDLAAGYWALTGGASDLAYEIPSPYQEDDLFDLKVIQSADVMWIFHPTYPTKELTRTGHTAWTLTNHLSKIGVVMTITGISNAATAVVTCTTVPTTLAAGDIVYITGVVGMTQVNDLFFTVGTVTTGAGGTFQLSGINSTAYTPWVSDGTAQECLYGTEDHRPSCGTFFEQRLCMGGANDTPQRFDMSGSGDYDDWNLGSDDDDAIQFTLVSDMVDRLFWMIGQDYLMIGTAGGIWRIGASTSGDPLTQTNITAKKHITLGAKDVDPQIVTDSILWVTRGGATLRQLAYSFEVDKFIAPDLTRIAKHITLGDTRALSGITDMDFQQEPLPILWAVRADGQLLGLTYETQELVFAWFRIVTDGLFESVSVISDEGEEDEVWVIVKRNINNSDVRYIEYFKPIEFFGEIKDCFFVHSGLTWDGGDSDNVEGISKANPAVVTITAHSFTNGMKIRITGVLGMTQVNQGMTAAYTVTNAAANTFELSGITSVGWGTYISGGTCRQVKETISSGLDHLENETVDILIDGAVHPQKIVTSGSITLDWYGNLIHVGLPCEAIVEPMKLNAGSLLGTARGKKQKINRLTVAFYETAGAKAGPDQNDLKIIPFGTGVQPELFTGDKDFEFHGDWQNEATISIVQDQPLPMTVLAIIPRVTVNED